MKTKGYIDYQYIAPEHATIHERLQNWRRWVSVKGLAWTAHPMWRHLKEKEALESHERGEYSIPPNSLDAHDMEKLVALLPEKHRFAIRWWYVYSGNPLKAAKQAAVSKERLAELVKEGRTMLINRTGACDGKKNVVTSTNR